jgi:hypothetical protein
MVDSLVLVQTFVKVSFAAGTGPKQIPLVGFCVSEVVSFAERSHQFGVTLQNFVEELTVVDVVATLVVMAVCRCRWSIHK